MRLRGMKNFIEIFYQRCAKKLLRCIVASFLLSLLFGTSCSRVDSEKKYKTEELSPLVLRQFIGKPVGYFLSRINEEYFRYDFLDENPGVLSKCVVYYDECLIVLTVSTYDYINRYDPNMNWDFEEFKKEKISKIEILRE